MRRSRTPPSEPCRSDTGEPVALTVVTDGGERVPITCAELAAFVAAMKQEAQSRLQAIEPRRDAA